ncbi:MAG: hypothetical protein WC799_06185 [Desulfobacteraceae bacterium]|jgi:hypothetical protein
MNRFFKPMANTKDQVVVLIIGLFMFLAAVSMTGCDNGDSYEAKLEDARIALDDGNYALAESILATLPQTAMVLEYMSNAIAGGDLNLDTLNIISTLEDLDDEGNVGSIDMIGRIIGDENNQLTCEQITDKIQSATEAIELFKAIADLNGGGVQDLSDNQKTQLGLLSITRVVLTLAHRICIKTGGPVTMTEAWIQANRDANFSPLITAEESTSEEVTADLARINEDLVFIGYTIDVFADSNDMKDDFLEFKNEIDADLNGNVTYVELNAYIAQLGEDE